MCKLIDLTGQRFGRYVVLSRNGVGANGMAAWLCRCDCGNQKTVLGNNLRTKKVVSCGCYQREIAVKNGLATKRHGQTHTLTYKSWLAMKGRCLNKNDQAYALYGGRNISVCEEWIKSFEAFVKDMGVRKRGTTLERIDVNGDYTPSNCIWATPRQQARNKRSTIRVLYKGTLISLADAAEQSGIPYRVLLERRNRLGWDDLRLFEKYTGRKPKGTVPCPSSSPTDAC